MDQIISIEQKKNELYQIKTKEDTFPCDLLTAEEVALFYESQGYTVRWLYLEDIAYMNRKIQ